MQTTYHGYQLAVFNPHQKPLGELTVIYGYNAGGDSYGMAGNLIADDGTHCGAHICSNESFMVCDLGCIEGSRPDRHEGFKEAYPDGYRMEFVPLSEVESHKKLQAAFGKNIERHVAERLA